MDTFTIHLGTEKSAFLKNCVQSGFYIDPSDVIEKALEALHEKTKHALLARNILQHEIIIALAAIQSDTFSHRDITAVIEGKTLCDVKEKECIYQLTQQADNAIEDLLKTYLSTDNPAKAIQRIQKIENHIKGLTKLEHHQTLSKVFPPNEQLNTDNILYSKTNKYYLIYTLSETGINVLTLYSTQLDLEELKKTKTGTQPCLSPIAS
ncbi:MAG: hypothetical protein COB14_07450 [Alphaproteobacteria bacterium]|nr:MAG: hypothetical protein COB14_07450 [Alphaproteobacteria bacterium]